MTTIMIANIEIYEWKFKSFSRNFTSLTDEIVAQKTKCIQKGWVFLWFAEQLFKRSAKQA